jgi:hypothetical protein
LRKILYRNESLEAEVFKSALSSKDNLVQFLTSTAANLKDPKISSLFWQYITPLRSPNLFLDDLSSIVRGRTIYKSVRGIASGVTFIDGGREKLLFKWTDYRECVSQKIYALFLKIIGDPYIHTPLGRAVHESQIPGLKWLHKPLPKSEMEKPPSCLMLYEKAPGAPFIDFIAQKYELLLPEQRVSLFTLIGKTVMLDLLLGHQDRFFKLELPLKSAKLVKMKEINYGEYANLGNLLVNIEDGAIHIYLIDNGAHVDDQKIKYLTPFFRAAKNEATFSYLIEMITSQVIEAVKRAEFPSTVTIEMVKNMATFQADLLANKLAIQKGLQEMTQVLKERFENEGCLTLFKNLKPAFKRMGINGGFMNRISLCKTWNLDKPGKQKKPAACVSTKKYVTIASSKAV